MKKFTISVYGKTDIGISKTINEDRFLYEIIDEGEHVAGVFAIADGVGGLDKGDVASSVAISGIKHWWVKEFKDNYTNKEYLINSLIKTLNTINDTLIQLPGQHHFKMATTLSILLLYKDDAFLVHIGDSRIYKLSRANLRNCIKQLTLDHTTIIRFLQNGSIINKNVLTECLGNKKEINCFTNRLSLKAGDIFLLCSDGLYKTIQINEIKKYMNKYRNNMKELCNHLIKQVKYNSETDNVTVIAVKIS